MFLRCLNIPNKISIMLIHSIEPTFKLIYLSIIKVRLIITKCNDSCL